MLLAGRRLETGWASKARARLRRAPVRLRRGSSSALDGGARGNEGVSCRNLRRGWVKLALLLLLLLLVQLLVRLLL